MCFWNQENHMIRKENRFDFIDTQCERASQLILAAEKTNDRVWARDLNRMADQFIDMIKNISKDPISLPDGDLDKAA